MAVSLSWRAHTAQPMYISGRLAEDIHFEQLPNYLERGCYADDDILESVTMICYSLPWSHAMEICFCCFKYVSDFLSIYLFGHAALLLYHCNVLPQFKVAGLQGLGRQYEEQRKRGSVGHRAQEVIVVVVASLSLPCHVV